jgi:hypothetical protein
MGAATCAAKAHSAQGLSQHPCEAHTNSTGILAPGDSVDPLGIISEWDESFHRCKSVPLVTQGESSYRQSDELVAINPLREKYQL